MYFVTLAVVSLLLANLREFTESQECDNHQCKPGTFYNCTKCLDCPKGTFRPDSSMRTSCDPHTPCNDHEIEIVPGNTTHDRVCGLPEDNNQHSFTTPSPNNSYTTPSSENGGQLEKNIIIPVTITLVIILVIVAFLLIYCCKKKNEKDRRQHAENNNENVKMITKTKDEMAIAEQNIREHRSRLCRDMDSDKGLFWAALKEGRNGFTLEDHQTCLKMTSIARNGKILDLALNQKTKIKSLVYALILSEQPSLAKLISEALSNEDFKEKSNKWSPEVSYKEKLRNNRVFILMNLDLNEELWSYLREKDTFTLEDYETCKAKTTEYEGKDYIIDIMLKDEQKYRSFLEALKNTENYLYDKFAEAQNDSDEISLTQQKLGNMEV